MDEFIGYKGGYKEDIVEECLNNWYKKKELNFFRSPPLVVSLGKRLAMDADIF
jgi:hypothetical protein